MSSRDSGRRTRGTIAQRVRANIAAGALPIPERVTYQLFTRPGDGQACDGCDAPISSADVIFDVDVSERQLHFHAECLVEWHSTRAS